MIGWVLLGVTAWTAVALVVAVLIGRVIRHRDRQMPTGFDGGQPMDVPRQGGDRDPGTRSGRPVGRGRPPRP